MKGRWLLWSAILLVTCSGCQSDVGQRDTKMTSAQKMYVEQHGPPELIEQRAADLGRTFPWGLTPATSWNVEEESYIYTSRGRMAVFRGGRLIEERPYCRTEPRATTQPRSD